MPSGRAPIIVSGGGCSKPVRRDSWVAAIMYLIYTTLSASVGDCSKNGPSSFLDGGRRAPYLHTPISASGGDCNKKRPVAIPLVGDAVYLTCITPSLLQEGLLANMARCDSSLAAVVYLTYMPQSMPQEAIVATTARRHFWVTPSCFLWVMSASRVGALPPK